MSERALAFVEEWISDHITADDADGDIEAHAKALAGQCLADAGKRAFPPPRSATRSTISPSS